MGYPKWWLERMAQAAKASKPEPEPKAPTKAPEPKSEAPAEAPEPEE